jgi:maltoporin
MLVHSRDAPPANMKTSPVTALLLAAVLAALTPVSSPAQSPAEVQQIRQEIDQLRKDYEQRLRLLEEKLQKLEQAPAIPATPGITAVPAPATTNLAVAPGPATTPVSPEAVQHVRQFADEQYQRTTESREHALTQEKEMPFRQRVEKVLQDYVDIGGYFRAGYGRDNQGGTQVAFQAPGALAKYRLGNEAENYGELVFGKNFYVPGMFAVDPKLRPDQTPDGPIARVQLRMSMYNPYSDLNSSSSTTFGLPEAWASIGNVVAAQPSLKFWAGNRFYRRHDIHVDDFFFYNMSGGGGGVEDFELPFGKMALAWIGWGSANGFSDIYEPDPQNKVGFSKANWDLRLYDVALPLGQGEFGLVFASQESGQDAAGNSAPGAEGFSANFVHTREKFLSADGANKFSLQFGSGPGKTFISGFETMTLPEGVFIRPDARNSWRFRVTESFVADLSKEFSIGPVLLYQLTDYTEAGGLQQWFSTGVRPIWHFNKYLSLAFEGGVDWVQDDGTGLSDYLYKLTLAPQVSLGDRFMSRPVIRAFVTYAHWGGAFVDSVGGFDYLGQNQGWTFGMQMETWW